MDLYPVCVAGVDLVVEIPRKKPGRFLRDGEPLPRDRWDNWILTDAEGTVHRPEIGFSLWHRSPTVELPDEGKQVAVLRPLPTAAGTGLMAALVLGFLSGAGLVWVIAAEFVTFWVLRRMRPGPLRVVVTTLVWVPVVLALVMRFRSWW